MPASVIFCFPSRGTFARARYFPSASLLKAAGNAVLPRQMRPFLLLSNGQQHDIACKRRPCYGGGRCRHCDAAFLCVRVPGGSRFVRHRLNPGVGIARPPVAFSPMQGISPSVPRRIALPPLRQKRPPAEAATPCI